MALQHAAGASSGLCMEDAKAKLKQDEEGRSGSPSIAFVNTIAADDIIIINETQTRQTINHSLHSQCAS